MPFFRGGLGRLAPRRRLARFLSGQGRAVVISRGEQGISTLEHVSRLQLEPAPIRVYEAHRLYADFVEQLEFRPRGWLARMGRRDAGRFEALERRAVEQSHGVICLTNAVRAALQERYRLPVPTLVLPSGVAPHHGPLPDDAARDIDILYAGKLRARKGVRQVVQAMRFLPAFRLCVLGGTRAEIDELRGFASEQGVAARIDFDGWIEPGKVREYFLRARVGVCPLLVSKGRIAERFTSPLKVLEMMACGVPVVASDVPSMRELLEADRTALLVPAEQPRELASAIERLLGDRVLAARLAGAARARAAELTWDDRARRLDEFLQTLE